MYAGKDVEADLQVQQEISGAKVDGEGSLSLSLSISEAQASIADVEEQLTRGPSGELEVLQQRLRLAQQQLAEALDEGKKQQVRNLYMLDHPPLLLDALNSAANRLLIISPWIFAVVVDASFLRKLETLLTRGVRVWIGYGINEEETQLKKTPDIEARKALRDLSVRFANFTLMRLGDTHAKVLIKDSEFAVVTSFNWLSFRGDPHRKLRDEQGVLIQRADLVDQKFAELIGRFGSPCDVTE